MERSFKNFVDMSDEDLAALIDSAKVYGYTYFCKVPECLIFYRGENDICKYCQKPMMSLDYTNSIELAKTIKLINFLRYDYENKKGNK